MREFEELDTVVRQYDHRVRKLGHELRLARGEFAPALEEVGVAPGACVIGNAAATQYGAARRGRGEGE